MAGNGLPIERLRKYLLELTPGARALLIGELERGLLHGDNTPTNELVLQELRRAVREAGRPVQRVDDPARLFFRPLEPFLVDDPSDRKVRGRIGRSSLNRAWMLLTRELIPAESKAYSDEVAAALLDGATERVERLTRAFQDRAVETLRAVLDAAQVDEKGRRRLAGHMGASHALEDLRDIVHVLQARDTLAALAARLPGHIGTLADDQLSCVKAQLDSPTSRQSDVFPYALVLVMGRLVHPCQLIRLATRAAESDVAARVAETPYAVAVTMVLVELERMVSELRNELKSGRSVAVTSLLKRIHHTVRGLRTELDLSGDATWGKPLATLRAEISGLLTREIETVPGRVRRLLRPRPAKEVPAGTLLDPADIADTEMMIDFVGACRIYASELAINEISLRVFSELQQYLDTNIRALVDNLRHAGAGDLPFRQSQVEAAIRFCAKFFSQGYAAQLNKAAKAAELGPDAERKVVKA